MQVHLYLTCADSGVLQFVALRRINNLRTFNIMMSSTPRAPLFRNTYGGLVQPASEANLTLCDLTLLCRMVAPATKFKPVSVLQRRSK